MINIKKKVQKINRNRAASPGGSVTEMLSALCDFGIAKITDVINEI